jgi:hypothetical protein
MTKATINIATPLGIAVHDHVIVGKNGHASLKGMKLISTGEVRFRAFTLRFSPRPRTC